MNNINSTAKMAAEMCNMSDTEPKEIAIFGFDHCHWGRVENSLRMGKDLKGNKIFENVYNYKNKSCFKTDSDKGQMKGMISEIIFKNYQTLVSEKGQYIPLLFCVETNISFIPVPTPESLTSKQKNYWTHFELRRAVKHCILDEILPDTQIPGLEKEKMKDIASILVFIADLTLHAVKVTIEEESIPSGHPIKTIKNIERIDGFFTKKEYDPLIKGRRKDGKKKAKKNGWREQLFTLISKLPASSESTSSSTSSLTQSVSLKDFDEKKNLKDLKSPKTS